MALLLTFQGFGRAHLSSIASLPLEGKSHACSCIVLSVLLSGVLLGSLAGSLVNGLFVALGCPFHRSSMSQGFLVTEE